MQLNDDQKKALKILARLGRTTLAMVTDVYHSPEFDGFELDEETFLEQQQDVESLLRGLQVAGLAEDFMAEIKSPLGFPMLTESGWEITEPGAAEAQKLPESLLEGLTFPATAKN